MAEPEQEITYERILATQSRLGRMLFVDEKTTEILDGCRRKVEGQKPLSPAQVKAFLKIELRSQGKTPEPIQRTFYDVLATVTGPGGRPEWHKIGTGVSTVDKEGISVKLASTPFNWDGSFVIKQRT